jgi:hypothetical protein
VAIEIQKLISTKVDYVYFCPERPNSARDCLNLMTQFANYCRENRPPRVLVNVTPLFYELSTGLEVFQFGSGLAQVWPLGSRLALICDSIQYDSGRFAQTVARNRGLLFGLFEECDEPQARAWLNRRSYLVQPPDDIHSLDVFTDNS